MRADVRESLVFECITPTNSAGGCVVGCVASGAFPPTRRQMRKDARSTSSAAARNAVHVPQKRPNPSHPQTRYSADASCANLQAAEQYFSMARCIAPGHEEASHWLGAVREALALVAEREANGGAAPADVNAGHDEL